MRCYFLVVTAASDTSPDHSFRHQVAAEVRAQMARLQVSNRRLATQLGLKPAYVDRRLNGTTAMDTDDIQMFAGALGVNVDVLLRHAIYRTSYLPADGGRDPLHSVASRTDTGTYTPRFGRTSRSGTTTLSLVHGAAGTNADVADPNGSWPPEGGYATDRNGSSASETVNNADAA